MKRNGFGEEGLKELFHQEIRLDAEKKTKSVESLHKAVAEKGAPHQMKMAEVIRSQIRFLDGKIFAIQGAAAITVMMLSVMLSKNNGSQEHFLAMSSIFAGLFGIFVPFSCGREYTSGIVELAESCFFNMQQSCILKMVVYGGMDLLLLFLLMAFIRGSVQMNFFELGIYVLVPFLFSCCIYFGVLMTGTGRKNSYIFVGAGVLISAALGMLASYPWIYEPAAFFLWIFSVPFAILLLAAEISCFFRKMEKGEILCMN